MVEINKYDYVQQQPQTRLHECHWPGCTIQVPPARWGCRPHWFTLPREIRARIWDAYVPGQEITRDVSREYIEAARDAQVWIRNYQENEEMGRKKKTDTSTPVVPTEQAAVPTNIPQMTHAPRQEEKPVDPELLSLRVLLVSAYTGCFAAGGSDPATALNNAEQVTDNIICRYTEVLHQIRQKGIR